MIAGLLGGTIVGDKNAAVHTVSSIEGGKKGALTYLSNPKYEQYIYSTEASIVLVSNDFEPKQEVAATLIKLPDVGAAVLRERKTLSESGVITAVVAVDMKERCIVTGPEIISRGFIFVREAEELMAELKDLTRETLENCLDKGMTSRNAIKEAITRKLDDYLYKKTKREPLIVPILLEM